MIDIDIIKKQYGSMANVVLVTMVSMEFYIFENETCLATYSAS